MQFDSKEEQEFQYWVDELINAEILKGYLYHPNPFHLTNKVSYQYKIESKRKTLDRQKLLLRPMIYTPDWILYVSEKGEKFFDTFSVDLDRSLTYKTIPKNPTMYRHGNRIFVDVKGTYDPHGDGRYFTAMQKIVYDHYGIFVNKVVIGTKNNTLFEKTFTPKKSLFTKTKKQRSFQFKPILLDDILSRIEHIK